MLIGRFGNTTGCPYVDGLLLIKRLKVRHLISFCVDTGSDETVLLPLDSRSIPIDFSLLKTKSMSWTLNGECELYSVPAKIQFLTSSHIFSYEIDLKIAPDNPELMQLPSIVGRNIIDHWSMDYCKKENRLNIEVLNADHVQEYIPTP